MILVALSPGNILAWLLAGLIAGAIAGRLIRGRGFGCLGDIVVGLVGAFIGGLIISPFIHGSATLGFLGTTAVALLGAVVFATHSPPCSSREQSLRLA